MKKFFTFFIALTMVCSCCLSVFADPETDVYIEPEIIDEYQYTYNINSYLSISSNKATCESVVTGYSNLATRVEITQTLQKKSGSSWNFYTSWVKNYYTWYGMLQTTKSGLSSGTYRLKTVAKVYSGNSYETITIYSNTKTC